jgi:hypothetical protein
MSRRTRFDTRLPGYLFVVREAPSGPDDTWGADPGGPLADPAVVRVHRESVDVDQDRRTRNVGSMDEGHGALSATRPAIAETPTHLDAVCGVARASLRKGPWLRRVVDHQVRLVTRVEFEQSLLLRGPALFLT